ncbi:MAG TPA: efflux RND transporter periplasmic adaptor subunit [Rhizomicrobium sp.]|nr:efflux RND transporter periplasmic adaptor subunit [Rhizomicrobium sp.]
MIDLAATSLQLRASKRNTLKDHMFPKNRRSFLAGLALIALGGGWYAIHHIAPAGASQVAAASPAVPVNVMTARPQTVRIWSEFSGKLDAVDYAEIRPEVGGRITEIRFRDGQNVNAGDILFVIDPRPYQAAVAKAEADLQSARTNAALAKSNLVRAENLRKADAIALASYDQSVNASAVAEAAIQSAAAALAQTRLDVDRAYVKAPITGRVGRAEITLGNLVQVATGAPLLTSIVSRDGIYADFDVDEQTYIRNIHDHAQSQDQQQKIPVELTLQGDGGHVYQGYIESFDNRINTGSGTIRARARFENADGALVPGMFVSVRLANAADSKVLLVPERAIGTDQSKKFLFVADKDSKAAFREVTLGQSVDGNRVVLSGLQPGERVIVDGVQHIAPGAPVQVQEIQRNVAAR